MLLKEGRYNVVLNRQEVVLEITVGYEDNGRLYTLKKEE